MKSSKNFLETDAPLKVVLKLAIPSMLAQFVNVLYSIVDRIYIPPCPSKWEKRTSTARRKF